MGVGSKLDICSRHEVDYLSKVFGTVTVVLVGGEMAVVDGEGSIASSAHSEGGFWLLLFLLSLLLILALLLSLLSFSSYLSLCCCHCVCCNHDG